MVVVVFVLEGIWLLLCLSWRGYGCCCVCPRGDMVVGVFVLEGIWLLLLKLHYRHLQVHNTKRLLKG